MKIVNFSTSATEEPRPGMLIGDTIYDLSKTQHATGSRTPFANAIISFHEGKINHPEDIETSTHDRSDVHLDSPVADDTRVICLGGVYAQHLRERNDSLNQVPSQWITPKYTLVGQHDDIILPEKVEQKVVPAVELGVVIGESCRYIEESEVYDAIAGYTICNDITARTDWPGPMGYKLMDTFWPTGPSITPSQDVSNPMNLKMRITQDGSTICEGTTASMRFTIPFLVSHLSSILELRPGDIISTGDPGNVESKLKPNTTLRTSIEEIDILENNVVSDSAE